MEQLQLGYIRTVAAAAGCNIVGVPEVDEGIDIVLSHKSNAHNGSGAVYLEVQLKSTAAFAGDVPEFVSSQMRRDRYDEFRSDTPNMDRILVIMSMPDNAEDWLRASHDYLEVRHCAYWVNLRGEGEVSATKPTVKAPTLNVFDDVALCAIMARIGQGQAP